MRAGFTESRSQLILLAIGTITLCLCLSVLYLWAASSGKWPAREQMKLGEVPVLVECSTSVSTQELGLPFYPQAKVEKSLSYRVTIKDTGKSVGYYGFVVLLTPDTPAMVAEKYSVLLPGRPNPETVNDQDGTRQVLAIANDREVRTVTITAHDSGSRIQLLRATETKIPPPPLKPKGKEKVL